MTELRLSGSGLVRNFGGTAGIHGVDIEVKAGQVHALVGLNGAGKTTLLRLFLGMLKPDSGAVHIDGHNLNDLDADRWASVGHLIGAPLAYPELNTRTNLAIAARLHGISDARIAPMVREAMSALELDRYANVRARVLSEGNRQRLGLASALQHRPNLVILDEPTNALDPAGVILLRELLLHHAANGAGVLVSSHHLDEVARIADRITVINRGLVIGSLDPQGVDIERRFFALVHSDDRERTP